MKIIWVTLSKSNHEDERRGQCAIYITGFHQGKLFFYLTLNMFEPAKDVTRVHS